MIRHTHRTRFARTRIAIIERQIGVVHNVDESPNAIAYMLQAIVIRLRSNGRVFRGKTHNANAHCACARAAFVIGTRTISRRIASDALTQIVT
jgi:ribosomal protein L35AE/L33A